MNSEYGTTDPALLSAPCGGRPFRVRTVTSASPPAGTSRRYQANAVHASKACNIISKYTAFVPVDINKSRYLPTVVGYPNSGKAEAGSSQWAGGGRWGAEEPRRWQGVQGKASRSEKAPGRGSDRQGVGGSQAPSLLLCRGLQNHPTPFFPTK